MPIGTQIPGQPTEVTPDASPALYTSIEGPAPDGPVVAADVLGCLLATLNVQNALDAAKVPVAYVPQTSDARYYQLPMAGGCLADYLTSHIGWQLSTIGTWIQTDVANVGDGSAGLLYFDLEIPYPCKLTGVWIRLAGNTAHTPEHTPYAAVYSFVPGSAPVLLGEIQDPTSGSGYSTVHTIAPVDGGTGGLSVTNPDAVVTQSTRYFLTIVGEYGTNAVTGAIVAAIYYRLQKV
jgi:hypothetical protein